jgi:spore coat polysaccharide biosynthesis protein SpsF
VSVVAAIVQARLGSSRLPAKVLLPLPQGTMTLGGREWAPAATVLEEVVNRCMAICGVDVVAAAIPDTPENDILAEILKRGQEDRQEHDGDPDFKIVRGPEHDVLARYAKAAEAVKADIIMRITADCPLIDPEVCGQVLATVNRFDGDKLVFATNNEPRTFPHGFDCEVFTRALLDAAVANTKAGHMIDDRGNRHAENPDREHVTPWMRGNAADKHFIFAEGENRSHLRWTLDTLSDYVTIWNEMERQMREAA